MSDIQMTFEKAYCTADGYTKDYFCEDCFTEWAEDIGCPYYSGKRSGHVSHGDEILGWVNFDHCLDAALQTIHKGMATKNYEVEYDEHPYRPGVDCAIVTARNRKYVCSRVVIDGWQVFPLSDNKEAEDENT